MVTESMRAGLGGIVDAEDQLVAHLNSDASAFSPGLSSLGLAPQPENMIMN